MFVTFPNLAWTERSTFQDIVLLQPVSSNSAVAISGGAFYLLAYAASLYNLLFLGAMRFYAIQCPERYRQMSSRIVHLGIGVTWILACIVAGVPGSLCVIKCIDILQ